MLNVNRLSNSTRLTIAAAIAEEVYSLELDDEALIHELRRYGFSQAYAEAMTYRYVSPEFAANEPKPMRQRAKREKSIPTSCPGWFFVDDVLVKATA